MAKKNFNDLISKSFNNKSEKDLTVTVQGENESAQLIPYDRIKKNPMNTDNDKTEETIQSIKISIKTLGLIEPPIVYKDDDGFYMLISGEGRITAIGKLKEEEKCFEKILCKVIPKPANSHLERLLIMSANEQRNAPSIERTHKNIKEMCRQAKILADEGKGEFNELIKGMTLLKKSALYNYNRIYNNLIDGWLNLFDDETIGVKDAILIAGYTRGEQRILLEQHKDPGFKFEKDYIDNLLQPFAENEEKKQIEKLDQELQKTKKEKQKLEKVVKKQQEDTSRLPEKEKKKNEKKEEKYKEKLRQKEKELNLAQEKLKRAEQMLPVFSDEEMEKSKKEQELMYSVKKLQQQVEEISKLAASYKKKYGNTPNEFESIIEKCITIANRIN